MLPAAQHTAQAHDPLPGCLWGPCTSVYMANAACCSQATLASRTHSLPLRGVPSAVHSTCPVLRTRLCQPCAVHSGGVANQHDCFGPPCLSCGPAASCLACGDCLPWAALVGLASRQSSAMASMDAMRVPLCARSLQQDIPLSIFRLLRCWWRLRCSAKPRTRWWR